jgi:hypothetical protein
MPENKLSEPITDQEIASARLVLSRAMTDRQAADLSERAVEGLNPDREQVLTRLWEIANLCPEATRGSLTGQVKALSMIVAIQNFIPDRRAASSEKKSSPATAAEIYAAAWRRGQQATTTDPQPGNAPPPQKDSTGVPASPGAPRKPEVPSPLETPPSASHAPAFSWVPDTRGGFSIKNNPFTRPR